MVNEDRDYISVERGTQTIFKKFRKALVEIEQRYTKDHKPYCRRAAKMDWEEYANKRVRQLGKREDQVTEKELNFKDFDFEKYGDKKYFTLQSTTDAVERVKVGIGTQHVVIGVQENYVHKPSGSGVSVYIPKELKERNPVADVTSSTTTTTVGN